MKILGISDATDTLIYSSVAPQLYKDVDLVISAGDLPLRYYDYIATMLNKDVCWVYGNHNLDDWDRMMGRGSDSMKDLTDLQMSGEMSMLPRFGGMFADGKIIYDKNRDLIIAGLGGSNLYNYGNSQYSEKQMAWRIRWLAPRLKAMKLRYGRYCDILITHAPPRGIGDGEDLCHKGFECFLDFMDKYKPKYLLHGHVHLEDMNAPRVTEYNQTKVINIYKNFILEDDSLGGKKMTSYENHVANEEFNKAKTRAKIQSLMKTLSWKNNDLLSWYEVTSIIKPKSETYVGMRTIPVDKIIGSEGRYRDFSAAFMPKREMLRNRWVSVDAALHSDVILPPISVYSLGGWYFVRDGNHRVSVAKAMGQDFIDAEVVELDSKIPLDPGMSMRELRRRVVQYERSMFLEQYGSLNLPLGDIVFTTPGAYPELVNHIMVHKYYINQNIKDREISMEEAAKSWYENVYSPIVKVVREEHLLSAFPGNTEGDMYMWLVRRWDQMKSENKDSSIEDTVKAVEKESGTFGTLKRKIRFLIDQVKRQ